MVLSPCIDYLVNCDYQNIGVIGTKRTIESNVFDIKNKNIKMLATPSFVPIIENNLINEKENEIINELSIFNDSDILVLGCTHYPVLKKLIENNLNIMTLDMGEVLVNNIHLDNNSKYKCELYFSLVSVNLITNIDNILKTDYKIYMQ